MWQMNKKSQKYAKRLQDTRGLLRKSRNFSVCIGQALEFPEGCGRTIIIEHKKYAVFRFQGKLGCIGNSCLHAGGPLGEGRIRDGRVYCAWHNWDWDFQTGRGYGDESVGGYVIWEENNKVYVDHAHVIMPLKVAPAHKKITITPKVFDDGTLRILGISTTMMNLENPRASTSEYTLEQAFSAFQGKQGFETRVLKLRELRFRTCEGYYSRDKAACLWPCSLTQADKDDQLIDLYRALVEWCDIVIVATPIRWNSASSLYYKMQERLNCIQNQITLYDRVLIKNKVAGFIITGGQDGVQAVAGSMMMFFSELGFTFGQFPFVGWSRGWYNENMKTNFGDAQNSDLVSEAVKMIQRACELIATYRNQQHHYSSHKRHK